jgi:hypothetical protein
MPLRSPAHQVRLMQMTVTVIQRSLRREHAGG